MPQAPIRTIQAATRSYETWLRAQTPIVERDLRSKHQQMRASPFAFLRATYYRWAELWPIECRDLQGAPAVAAVGDLHVENFGTWRDAEGRLAWGLNDFDEASRLPYTNDLVRLAASAFLARKEARLTIAKGDVVESLLDGYATGLRKGGVPVILAERHGRLGEAIVRTLVQPKRFWTEKFGEDLRPTPRASAAAQVALRQALPGGSRRVVYRFRVAGLGSRGRLRFVAIAEWAGGSIAREAKALTPPAAVWASPQAAIDAADCRAQLMVGAVRSRDPFLSLSGDWIVRRLAPDSDKIQLAALGSHDLEVRLVSLMGHEVANVHLATPRAARAILRDLGRRDAGWLGTAARRMVERVREDHEAWSSEEDAS